jgi:FkbM family methyltransferase
MGKQALWDRVAAHLWWLESDVEAKTSFGATVSVDAGDVTGRYIYYFGMKEPNLTEWIARRLRPGDVFVDVGANIGYFSLLASGLVGDSGKVIAVEALPKIFERLVSNVKANRASNVRTVCSAAWDRRQTLTLYTRADRPPGTTTAVPILADRWRLEDKCQVSAAPLSAILRPYEMRAVRLVKIDVEGAEWHVVAGMTPLLQVCRDDLEIVIEVTRKALVADGKCPEDLLDFFASWGFHAYRIENDYAGSAYFGNNVPLRPTRIEAFPTATEQADLIFSRVDAASL